MRDTFIERFSNRAKDDKRLMLVTGDLGFGVLTEFAQDCPNQFVNAGVAEQNMTGLATGMALSGKVVFTYSIANFPTLRCLEQIRNDAAYHDANVNVVSIGGGFSYGALGMSHHATEDLAIMRAIPQVTVFSPGCLWEVEQATDLLISTPGAGFLRLDKSFAESTESKNPNFALGEPRLLESGSDITIVTTGGVLDEVLNSVSDLREQGIKSDVFSCHTIKPFNSQEILESVIRTKRLIVVEEHIVSGGLAGLLSEELITSGVMPEKFRRVGITGGFCSVVGSQSYLRSLYGLDATSLTALARELLN